VDLRTPGDLDEMGSSWNTPGMADSRTRPRAQFLLGVVGFGLLMGLRESVHGLGLRALIAGVAGAWLAAFAFSAQAARRRHASGAQNPPS